MSQGPKRKHQTVSEKKSTYSRLLTLNPKHVAPSMHMQEDGTPSKPGDNLMCLACGQNITLNGTFDLFNWNKHRTTAKHISSADRLPAYKDPEAVNTLFNCGVVKAVKTDTAPTLSQALAQQAGTGGVGGGVGEGGGVGGVAGAGDDVIHILDDAPIRVPGGRSSMNTTNSMNSVATRFLCVGKSKPSWKILIHTYTEPVPPHDKYIHEGVVGGQGVMKSTRWLHLDLNSGLANCALPHPPTPPPCRMLSTWRDGR